MAKKAKKRRAPAKKRVVKRAIKRVVKRKKIARKPSKKPVRAKKKAAKKRNVIGIITHYFPHVRAAVVKLKAPLVVGDTIKIKGHTTDFTQTITSLQIDRVPVNSAKKGQEIGLLVNSRVRQHDVVSKP